MKKIITLAMFATLLFYCSQVSAKIRRIGYFGTPVAGTDYINLQLAHDSANAKDTILIFPGNWNASVSKKIVLLGYGYFVAGTGANANLQNITGTLSVRCNLYPGADSSIYEGIDGLNVFMNYNQAVNKVIIRRCNVTIGFNNKIVDSWQILQSNIADLSYNYSGGKVTNLRINNCYIANLYLIGGDGDQNGQFNNTIINGVSSLEFGNGSFVIKNSILLRYHGYDANCVYQNCIANTDYFSISSGNGNKNITGAGMRDSVFVGYTTQDTSSNDGRWVLKPGSLAKGAGAGGTDCGIFGGTNPYKLSGIPAIPSFYKLSATSNITGANPYKITFSVRSNN